MDAFPNIGGMSDPELRNLLKELTDEEMYVSYTRRILQGKMDIIRAELAIRERRDREPGGADPGGADPSDVREPRRPNPHSGAGAVSLPAPDEPEVSEQESPPGPWFSG